MVQHVATTCGNRLGEVAGTLEVEVECVYVHACFVHVLLGCISQARNKIGRLNNIGNRGEQSAGMHYYTSESNNT